MRKDFLYYYKKYDNEYQSDLEKINREAFNEYGYNFDSNKRKTINNESLAFKTCHKRVNTSKEKKNI